jgi:hypothetical protein
MIPFLKIVAGDILNQFGSELEKICIVFPNRRSILYFNKHLTQILTRPSWAPTCLTISEFIQSFSRLRKADDLLLNFNLYKTYCSVLNSSESFDSFYHWGELLLSDFDDIDKYQVDAQALFQNLSALKNINELFSYLDENQIGAIQQFWKSFESPIQNSYQKGFNDLWIALFNVYSHFKETLIHEGLAYEGMIYKDASESITENTIQKLEFKKVIFAGFNALTKCEKEIFSKFKHADKALFYWDYDIEYISNTEHEAGFFIRDNITKFPSALDDKYFNNLQTKGKFNTFAVPSKTGQAKVAGQLINQIQLSDKELEKTAILLADESMLINLLHSIPENVENINITMGFPLSDSPIVTLINAIGQMHLNTQKNGEPGKVKFYYKNVLEILSHKYIALTNTEAIKIFELKLLSENLIYIEVSDLPEDEIVKDIFFVPDDGNSLIKNMSVIINKLGTRLNSNNNNQLVDDMEAEMLIIAYKNINRLNDLLASGKMKIELSLALQLIMKIMNNLSMPFEGEPLQGLQLMGFLESRALDFENIIMLDVNEGKLPKSTMAQSFIPYNLRKGFGLPTLEYRDAIYAYYFYRIIQRAEQVFLIYNTATEKISNSEVSRYVTQLMYDNKNKLSKKVQVFSIIPETSHDMIVNKDHEVQEILEKYVDGPDSKPFISPSALNCYIGCSLQFYFQYVARIKEYEYPKEGIDAAMLGEILHDAMNNIYRPFINRKIEKDELKSLLKREEYIGEIIKNSIFKELLKKNDQAGRIQLNGRNYIIYKILHKYILQIIDTDIRYMPIHFVALEHHVTSTFTIKRAGKDTKIRLGGYIDRIDQMTGNLRIVDYKTGNFEKKFKEIDELFIPLTGQKSKKELLQVFLYCLIYKKIINVSSKVTPCLYDIRNMFDDNFDAMITKGKDTITDISEVENEVHDQLIKLLEEIFNPNIPFTQTADSDHCRLCPYKEICHR